MNPSPHNTQRATSFLDVMITVSVIGIIGAMVAISIGYAPKSAEDTRLHSQTESLNTAAKLYLGSGGSLVGVTTAEGVFTKLKSVASNGEKLPGFRGSFIDPRLEIEMQSDAEASTNALRVHWNPAEQSFFIAENGPVGIKAFHIDSTETAEATLAEHRNVNWEFSATDSQGNWVWDYNRDTSDPVTGSLSTIPTGGDAGDPTSGFENKTQLQSPMFSPASGSFPLRDFDLPVELANPNPIGSSVIYVSINGSAYQIYTAPVSASPGSSVTAFAAPSDPATHYASFTRTEAYQGSGTILDAPVFSADSDSCCDSDYPKVISLTDPNSNTPSEIVYSLNGGTDTVYAGPITIPGNTEVTAYARSSVDDIDVYDSTIETRLWESIPETQLAAPAMSPDGGEHEDLVIVTLAAGETAPQGSRIFYTTDGTDPGVDANGEPINGTLYSEALVLSVDDFNGTPGNYMIDWDTDLWNDGQGWLDNEWNITQTLNDIGGSGIDVAVNLHGGPPAGDVPGPNLAEFSPLGIQTNLRSTAGDLPDFYYSLSFSQAISLDNFATGGLFTFFDEMLANRVDLFDPEGNQIALDSSYVTDYDQARVDILEDGIETVGTTIMNDPIVDSGRSTTYYDFEGLEVSEMRWWHYAYEVAAPAFNGSSEAVPGAESVAVGNDTVTYVGVLYDYPEPDTSTWFYIVESGEQPEISHVTFDIDDESVVLGGVDGAGTWSGSFPNINLSSGGGDPEIGYDRKTAAWGLKYDEGFSAYQERRYYFTVDGNYERTSIPVLTKAGNAADSAPITGPGLTESLGQSIASFTLIDTNTNQPVPGYESMDNGAVLDLAFLPTNFTIRANTAPSAVGSVRFDLNGEVNFKSEQHIPYCLMGDNAGDYAPWNPVTGSHQLVATPFTEANQSGTAGIPAILQFSVINTAQQIGHDKSSFLSDIGFHIDGQYEVVARVYPPSGNSQCTFPSELTRKIFTLVEPSGGNAVADNN